MPVYNVAPDLLQRCLRSIEAQTYPSVQLIVADDGSDAPVPDAIRMPHRGLAATRNDALRHATGDYVMFVDADDRLLPGAIENAVRLIREHDVDILQFGVKIKALYPGIDVPRWEKSFISKEWTSEGLNILYDCFSMHRFLNYIWNKIYRGDVCRAAGAAMPDLRVSFPADVLQTFFFLYYAKTFRSVPDGPYYEYSVGNGISTSSPTAQKFSALCAGSAILPAIEDFLKRENALENNRFLLDAIRIHIQSGALNELLKLPEITKETFDLAVKTWGSEILYDFIKATGLLDVQCKSRYKLVPALVDQIQKLQKEAPPSAGGITLSVGGEKK